MPSITKYLACAVMLTNMSIIGQSSRASDDQLGDNIAHLQQVRLANGEIVWRLWTSVTLSPAKAYAGATTNIPRCTPSKSDEGKVVWTKIIIQSVISEVVKLPPSVTKSLGTGATVLTEEVFKKGVVEPVADAAARPIVINSETVANCKLVPDDVPPDDVDDVKDFHLKSVSLFARNLGREKWEPFPAVGTVARCPIGEAAWGRLPTEASLRHERPPTLEEQANPYALKDWAFARVLLGSGAMFLNWSKDATRRGLIVVDFTKAR